MASHITFDECMKSSEKFNSRGIWATSESRYYQCAYRRGWIESCCSHMHPPKLGKKRTLSECQGSALMYKTRTAWQNGDLKHYDYAHNKDWLDECCMHMIITYKTTEVQVELINNEKQKKIFNKLNILLK